MQEPDSWVIRLESNGQITSNRQKRYVPSRWIAEVEGIDAGCDVVRGCALGKNDKIVAVKMNWMIGLCRDLAREPREVGVGDDEVDIALAVVLRNNCVVRVEGRVVEIQDGWV